MAKDLFKVFQRRGLMSGGKLLFSTVSDVFFDSRYLPCSTQGATDPREHSSHPNSNFATWYRPSRGKCLLSLLNKLNLPRQYTFVDIGCGKGRALMIAGMAGFNNTVGVEFVSTLAADALANCQAFKNNYPHFNYEIQLLEATEYIPKVEDTYFYFYDPFDLSLVVKVFKNIALTKMQQGLPFVFIYHHNFLRHEDLDFIVREAHLDEVKISNQQISGNQYFIFSSPLRIAGKKKIHFKTN